MKGCFIPAFTARTGSSRSARTAAFTLIELLIVIAIIGIMSSLVLTTVSNAAMDARRTLAYQQQVTLQDALNAWISANSSGTNSLSQAQTTYNAASAGTGRLNLLSNNYLHNTTYQHLLSNSTGTTVRSEAMVKSGMTLAFTAWTATNTPSVEWQ